MTRNAGILLKLKGILPIQVLKTLYHSFIQSHLNHCPLVWGLGNKCTLTPLFTAQKRAIRTLIPGFANYFYNKKTGEHPHHTKQVFAQHNIPTVHNLILERALTFMHKIVNASAPSSIQSHFRIEAFPSEGAPHHTLNVPQARLKPHKNSIFIKGPMLYNQFVPLVSNSLSRGRDPTQSMQPKPFKNCMKTYLLKQQSQGELDDWTSANFGLYTGTRKSERIAKQKT